MKETYKVLLSLDDTPMSWIVWASNGNEAMIKAEQELLDAFPDSIVIIKVCAKLRED